MNDISKFKSINESNPKNCKNENEEERESTSKKDIDKPDDKPSYNFPLQKNQLGYMNVYLQEFLNFDNKSICYKDENNYDEGRKLKEDTFCLLRLGIEKKLSNHFCIFYQMFMNFMIVKRGRKSREKIFQQKILMSLKIIL